MLSLYISDSERRKGWTDSYPFTACSWPIEIVWIEIIIQEGLYSLPCLELIKGIVILVDLEC